MSISSRSTRQVRKTRETSIELELNLDGSGACEGSTGIGFLDHLLSLFAAHSGFDLRLSAAGDTHVDDHHLVEDIGIVIGQALSQALGSKAGIHRYGAETLPMDDVLVLVAVDLGGRFWFASDYRPERETVGGLSTEMVNHFFRSLACAAMMNLHIRMLSAGENEHHRIEGIVKAFARALRTAVRRDSSLGDRIPSTKGSL